MRALVVYESMFGNTQVIANAIADGLAGRMRVDTVEVGVAPASIGDDVGLLVVGGPTHAFGMSRQGTRQDAAKQGKEGLVSTGIGIREWLAGLQGPLAWPRRRSTRGSARHGYRARPHVAPRSGCGASASGSSPLRRASTWRGRWVRCWTASGSAPGDGASSSGRPSGPAAHRPLHDAEEVRDVAGHRLPDGARGGIRGRSPPSHVHLDAGGQGAARRS
jgi:hypothetical protein